MSEHISIHCINSYPCILGKLLYIIGGRGAGSLAPLRPCPRWHGPPPTCSGPPTLDGVMAAMWMTAAAHRPWGPLLRRVGCSDGDYIALARYLTAWATSG